MRISIHKFSYLEVSVFADVFYPVEALSRQDLRRQIQHLYLEIQSCVRKGPFLVGVKVVGQVVHVQIVALPQEVWCQGRLLERMR